MRLSTRPLDNVGVEVIGFDIGQPVDAETQAELHELWNEHGILVFRNQDVNPERQISFSKIFGPLQSHPLANTTSREYPELFTLVNSPEKDNFITAYYAGEKVVGRLDWHMDLHYTGKPNRGAVLRAVVCAEQDGKTGFGDLAKAFDALDDRTKILLEKLELVYTYNVQRRHMRFVDLEGYEPGPHSPKKPSDIGHPNFSDVAYPAVVTHPITGRKVLEVCEQFLDRVYNTSEAELSSDEGIDLLQSLVDHIRKPEFHYFHEWRPGDMVLWDNWRAMHCTTGTPQGVERLIHRTTIAGDATLGRILAK